MIVEHPKSKSTQPRFARRWVTLYCKVCYVDFGSTIVISFRSPRTMFGRGRCYKKMALSSSSPPSAVVDNMMAAAQSFCHVVLRMTDADVPKFLFMQSGQGRTVN